MAKAAKGTKKTSAEVIAAAAGAAAIKPAGGDAPQEVVSNAGPAVTIRTNTEPSVEAGAPPAETRKRYITRFNVFTKKGERRGAGKAVFEDEIDNAAELVERGILSDPDAPVAPSIAGKLAVHKELISIALDGGLITRWGSSYQFAGKSIDGDLDALQSAVSSADVREAIVNKLKGRERL